MDDPDVRSAARHDPEFQRLIAARVHMQETELRSARLDRFLKISSVVLGLYWIHSIVYWLGVMMIADSLAMLCIALSFYLLKLMPHSRSASFVFLFTALGLVAFTSVMDGQLYAGSLYLLPIPTMAAAFLLGKAWSLGFAAMSLAIIAGNAWLVKVYPISTVFPQTMADLAMFRLAMLGILAGLAISSARMVRRTLDSIQRRKRETSSATLAAQDAEKTKRAFLANMSHEIRTPLHGIIGLTTQLERPGREPGDAAAIATMRDCAQDLLGLLNDVLDLSKVEAGKARLRHQAFCVDDLVERLAQSYAPRVEQKGLRWALDVPQKERWIFGDEVRLGQILSNLLDNAIEHSQTGTVTLSLREVALDKERVRLEWGVRDQGEGIGGEYLRRLQARFSSPTPILQEPTQDQGSLGLGLVLCDRLARLMNGTLSIESQAGKGTAVSLFVPLSKAPAQRRCRLDESQLEGLSVLVVDDSQINQRVAKLHLSHLQISADLASDANTAIEMCKQRQYDLILLDLRMPEIDGVQAAARIRQIEGYARLPMVASTAAMDEDWERRCKDVGIHLYLTKPFHPDSLRACLLKSFAGRTAKKDPGLVEQASRGG